LFRRLAQRYSRSAGNPNVKALLPSLCPPRLHELSRSSSAPLLLCSSAPLLLCSSAPLLICSSAPLRRRPITLDVSTPYHVPCPARSLGYVTGCGSDTGRCRGSGSMGQACSRPWRRLISRSESILPSPSVCVARHCPALGSARGTSIAAMLNIRVGPRLLRADSARVGQYTVKCLADHWPQTSDHSSTIAGQRAGFQQPWCRRLGGAGIKSDAATLGVHVLRCIITSVPLIYTGQTLRWLPFR
jgi:hypothetical protein